MSTRGSARGGGIGAKNNFRRTLRAKDRSKRLAWDFFLAAVRMRTNFELPPRSQIACLAVTAQRRIKRRGKRSAYKRRLPQGLAVGRNAERVPNNLLYRRSSNRGKAACGVASIAF